MDINAILNHEMVQSIFTVVLLPLLGVLTTYLCKYIQKKSDELDGIIDSNMDAAYAEKLNAYLDIATQAIQDAVIAVNQTYVDALKEQGKFDVEAQKIAFEKAKAAALASMDTAAREFLTTALGDFDAWLDTIIEKLVKDNKTPTAVLRNK